VSSSSTTGFTVDIDSSGFTTYTGSAGSATIFNLKNNAMRLTFDDDLTAEDNKKDQLVMAAKRATEKLIEYLSDL
jgi:hypothetical protein